MTKATLVQPYNSEWPYCFEEMKLFLTPALTGITHNIEHIGSTAVLGMIAKPIIDIDIIIERPLFLLVKERLEEIGYIHLGDKGISDREAFKLEDPQITQSLPPHHLYVCIIGAIALRDHLCFRNFMRKHPEWVDKLSKHKIHLCELHNNDRQSYIDGKSDIVRKITALAIKWKGI